jgi:metal-responsive CopG/Arc/MetJ family transcriptional regulator
MEEVSSCGVVNPSSVKANSKINCISENSRLELLALLGEAKRIRRLAGNLEATARRIIESKGC